MNSLIKKPYLPFFLAIPISILLGLLKDDEMLSLNIHDTYYVMSAQHLAIFISVLFGIIGLGYWLAHISNKKLSEKLIWVHIALTFVGTPIALILSQLYRSEFSEIDFNYNLTLFISVTFLLIVLGQLIFLINMITSLFKKN